jgi:hypothetical protein
MDWIYRVVFDSFFAEVLILLCFINVIYKMFIFGKNETAMLKSYRTCVFYAFSIRLVNYIMNINAIHIRLANSYGAFKKKMRTILLSIFVIFTMNSFSQQKIWSGDTTYWYNYQKHLHNKIGLKEIAKSEFLLAIRISSLNTITDIWTEDGKKFFGNQTYFTSTSEDNPENIKYLYKNEIISKDTAQLIKQLFDDYGIQYLPIQDSIEGWGNGFDGSTYLIEFATTKTYSFKSYWTPTAFPSVPEAVKLSEFIFRIDELLNLNHKFDNFIKSLPTDKSYITPASKQKELVVGFSDKGVRLPPPNLTI